jgi:hypothetical protein
VILRSCCGCMCMYECFALIITGAALAGGCLCAGAIFFHCLGVRPVHLVLVF